ncbi:MAG: metallophosphoesterase [Planctomycetaceae bacterium]
MQHPVVERENTDLHAGSISLMLGKAGLVLLPERAVWWPEQRTLLIADTHFGKEATFRRMSIPIPDQTTNDLQRLNQLLDRTDAARLIILGDLLHSRHGRSPIVFAEIAEWRKQQEQAVKEEVRHIIDILRDFGDDTEYQQQQQQLQITLVRGNHDLSAGDPPQDWHIECVDDPTPVAGLRLCHVPPADDLPGLAGHLHPVIGLRGPARDSLRMPCFLLRRETLVLPAFSSFVDGRKLSTTADEQVFCIAEDQVFAV